MYYETKNYSKEILNLDLDNNIIREKCKDYLQYSSIYTELMYYLLNEMKKFEIDDFEFDNTIVLSEEQKRKLADQIIEKNLKKIAENCNCSLLNEYQKSGINSLLLELEEYRKFKTELKNFLDFS
jgi:hypothetical protein